MPETERENYANWLWQAGYEEMGIIKPNLVLVLLVDPPICRDNIRRKAERNYTQGKEMDAAEEDFLHQMESAREYRKMIDKETDWWALIDCCENGVLRSKEDVHEMVWQEIQRRDLWKL